MDGRYMIYLPMDGEAKLIRCKENCLPEDAMERCCGGEWDVAPTVIDGRWTGEPNTEVVLVVNGAYQKSGLPLNRGACDISKMLYGKITGNALLCGRHKDELIGFRRSAGGAIKEGWRL